MNSPLINRLILRFLEDVQGIPQGEDELAEYVSGRQRRPSMRETAAALRTLSTLGYVARAEASAASDPLFVITPAGLRQILKQVPAAQLDSMIW